MLALQCFQTSPRVRSRCLHISQSHKPTHLTIAQPRTGSVEDVVSFATAIATTYPPKAIGFICLGFSRLEIGVSVPESWCWSNHCQTLKTSSPWPSHLRDFLFHYELSEALASSAVTALFAQCQYLGITWPTVAVRAHRTRRTSLCARFSASLRFPSFVRCFLCST